MMTLICASKRKDNIMTTDNMTGRNNSRSLMEFKDSINDQVEALQAACRDFLTKEREARSDESNELLPREIRIEVRIGLDKPDPPMRALNNDAHQLECWDNIYVCGHFLTGEPYYCSKVVCEVVEQITIAPG
jgi:hypothetical protein